MGQPVFTDHRREFLKLAVLFQGGLLFVALFAGWCLGNPVLPQCAWSFSAFGQGVLYTLPMLIVLPLVYRSRLRGFVEIRELLHNMLGRSLASCHWLDLVLLALLAGFSEEFFFRGVLEPFLARWNAWIGLIVCNLIFAGCHAVTITYVTVTFVIGIYLSLTLWWTSEPNLLIPITCHSLYDLIAFHVVRRSFLRDPSSAVLPQNSPIAETPDDL